ncbi:hypothetical protein [Capybara microvirus Cap1_SP_140]|nr:hypothetical protein [Capybara microvirus Cap1_SP_140]
MSGIPGAGSVGVSNGASSASGMSQASQGLAIASAIISGISMAGASNNHNASGWFHKKGVFERLTPLFNSAAQVASAVAI